MRFPKCVRSIALTQGMTGFDGWIFEIVCNVERGSQFVKGLHTVRANKSVPSPYAYAFGFAPAVA
jgi:hypothetical protein